MWLDMVMDWLQCYISADFKTLYNKVRSYNSYGLHTWNRLRTTHINLHHAQVINFNNWVVDERMFPEGVATPD